jgi:hypothetical protein
MRPCPVCGGMQRRRMVPRYWRFELYRCTCGMHFVDGAQLQPRWFDRYYRREYTTDDKPFSNERLDCLAGFIASLEPRSVLDIGGMDGELQRRLQERGLSCEISGVGDGARGQFDIVVLSHTLEHIYDVPTMMRRIQQNLGSRLIVEGPIWRDYEDLGYDPHWQHVNKFTVHHLEDLLRNHGFQIAQSAPLPDYREYHCHRVVAWMPE